LTSGKEAKAEHILLFVTFIIFRNNEMHSTL